MWWRFVDVPLESDLETTRAFRNAVLLTWPELSNRSFPVEWACAEAFGNSHQVIILSPAVVCSISSVSIGVRMS